MLYNKIKYAILQKEEAAMPYSDAQKRATAKYNAKAYDRIEVKVKKGQKEIIQKKAESQSKSLNSYIVDLIEQDLDKPDPADG